MARKGEATRTEIVECAKQLFYRQGYDRTSFSDIVQSSKLLRGNIYHYFKTKDDILEAVVDQRRKEFQALLARWDERSKGPKARLSAFVDMVTQNTTEVAEYGCPIGSLNTELGKARRDLQRIARVLFDLFRDWLTKCFAELGRSADAEDMALHLLGRAQGIAVVTQVYGDKKFLRRETKRLQTWVKQL